MADISIDTRGLDTLGLLPRCIDLAIAVGIQRTLPQAAQHLAVVTEGNTPYRSGRLVRSLQFEANRSASAVDLSAIFYAGPVNRATRFIDRSVDEARPEIERILLNEIQRALSEAFAGGCK